MTDSANVQFDFALDSKGVVTTTEDGDLIIEGIAADSVLDRMDEAFEPKAFDHAIEAYLAGNPILCYHHQYDKALGQVLDLKAQGPDLWFRARVDKPAPGSWAQDVYDKIKRGTIRAVSVGGRWHRRLGPDGRPRIWKADLAEVSVTPLAVNPRALFEVAGKAFGTDEPDLTALNRAVERLNTLFDRILAR